MVSNAQLISMLEEWMERSPKPSRYLSTSQLLSELKPGLSVRQLGKVLSMLNSNPGLSSKLRVERWNEGKHNKIWILHRNMYLIAPSTISGKHCPLLREFIMGYLSWAQSLAGAIGR